MIHLQMTSEHCTVNQKNTFVFQSLKLLQTVTDSLQSLNYSENKPLLDLLKQVVAADGLAACHQQLLQITDVKMCSDFEQNRIQVGQLLLA